MERAEEAILEEIRASGGQKAEDPFTRRSTKPTMCHRPNPEKLPLVPPLPLALANKPADSQPTTNEASKTDVKDKGKTLVAKPKTSDLFSAHDFDIKIDLEVPLPCK